MELVHVKGNTYYFKNPVAIGLYVVDDQKAILIDSGLDDDAAKAVDKILQQNGWTPVAVINTHSHADHCGGNNWFIKKYHVEVYATHLEAALIENPILEPCYLFGAYPYKELRNKFLMAKPSKVSHRFDMADSEIEVYGQKFTTTAVPGHSLGMVTVTTPDDICFLGDGLFHESLLKKHSLLFAYNLTDNLTSLVKLKHLNCAGYVMAHGGYAETITSIVDLNVQSLKDTSQTLLNLLKVPMTSEMLHASYVTQEGITENPSQYYLNLSVVKAHMSALMDQGMVTCTWTEGALEWSVNG